ncbi:glycoside hydrolase 43 family protein [uncultured Draconibacterium sp.]|uniref:glycoside hydrolase family 43 protein n=1 Tax=uncultured Draconibacterium sp. TaxID=1573823 RepID=UPI0032610A15
MLNRSAQKGIGNFATLRYAVLATKWILLYVLIFFISAPGLVCKAQPNQARNPIIFADVPDISIVRVDDVYYMSSTTMHMSPGVPIMKSNDLVNWNLVNYAYDTLANVNPLNLVNGKNAYGRGSWASCIRHHNNTFYVSTFAGTTGTTYIFSTKNIENGSWDLKKFQPAYHDHTLFFDDNGKTYMIWGAGKLMITELQSDFSGIKKETEKVLIENASALVGNEVYVRAEGSQLFKHNGKYYLFNIVWPRNGMRTVLIYRADKITGPYVGRIALQDRGIAQGGLIDTPDGNWFAYLFRDYGSVGRIPYLAPVKWENDWPVIGENGKVPHLLDLPAGNGLIPGIVASDEFERKENERDLPLVWQWNHNPVNENWSVRQRKGYLRLTTNRIDNQLTQTRNTLTQRTIGPECTGSVCLDVTNMKDGDLAGLVLLQKKYGLVGVKCEKGVRKVVMINAGNEEEEIVECVPLKLNTIYLKAYCNFTDCTDLADFYYSLDGENWKRIGNQLKMSYTMPHFMGYRFGLFNHATKNIGGYVDFDFFRISQN